MLKTVIATSSFRQHYDRLNSEQKRAVDTIEGPLLVLAGPGTGKTQLLSVRAAKILKTRKIEPENILMLTFTNAAARAMRERLALILGHNGYNVTVETFHSFANSVVLESEGAINFVKNKIDLSEVEKVRAIKYILDNIKGAEELRPFGAPYIHRNEIEKRLSELKREGILPVDFKKQIEKISAGHIDIEEKHILKLKSLAVIYEYYEKLKDEKAEEIFDERGRMDYDDMLLIALDALKTNGDLRRFFQNQYKYVMVDEYQDTNRVQCELLFSVLDSETKNICCVGDDDQSIYRFQGAALENFRELREKFSGLKEVYLVNNYRSDKSLVEISEKIISQLPEEERVAVKKIKSCKDYDKKGVFKAEFLTEEEELMFLVEKIREIAEEIRAHKTLSEEERNKPYNNIAVLTRTRVQIKKVIDVFLKEGIPYATDGEEDIREEKRVREMLDALELADASIEGVSDKSLVLYKVLSSDYINASHSDLLRFIAHVSDIRHKARLKGDLEKYRICNFFNEFLCCFPVKEDSPLAPEDSFGLEITKELELENPYALHKASWAIKRMLRDAGTGPVHDILIRYVNDTGLYEFILRAYKDKEVLKLRDLRALTSFINMVKKSDFASPALTLSGFMEEMELREMQGIPIKGELATMTQEGVRVYTAHGSKGLEFYAVFMPFCLDKKAWPYQGKADVVSLPGDVYKNKESVPGKERLKLLRQYDELRLFYVASTRAKAYLIYTASPAEKAIITQFLAQLDIEETTAYPEDERAFLVNFLKKNREEPSLEYTIDALKDLTANLIMTPTKLNTYLNCRRKFLYNYVLALCGRKDQHLVFGNCAHKALEEVYSCFMKEKKFPCFEYFKNAFMKELEFEGVNNAIRNWCLDRCETLKLWYAREARRAIMPQSLERELSVIISDGLIFKGKFDKTEELSDGTVRVIDYKTGKPDEHLKAIKYEGYVSLADTACDDYFRQLVAYKLVFDRTKASAKTGCRVSKGVIQFLEPVSRTIKKYNMEKGMFQDIEVALTDEKTMELECVIKEAWANIKNLKFERLPEKDDEKCARCDYDSICWRP